MRTGSGGCCGRCRRRGILRGDVHAGCWEMKSSQRPYQLLRERGKMVQLLLLSGEYCCLSRHLGGEMVSDCWIDIWRSLLLGSMCSFIRDTTSNAGTVQLTASRVS